MAKQIPCFVCGKLVEVTDERAIAKLCAEHDTTQNRDEMRNTPVHQLLRRLNDSVQQQVEQVAGDVGTTNARYEEIRQELIILQQKINGLAAAPIAPVEEPVKEAMKVNEFGEII